MVEIAPFRAFLYDTAKFPKDPLISPPYDKISDPAPYHASSPYNITRLDLPPESTGSTPGQRYAAAALTLDEWISRGVLVRDDALAIYPYHQIYTVGGRGLTRRGFCCLLRLESPQGRRVRAHEATRRAPREDRLIFLRAMRANLDAVFLLYRDPEQKVEGILAPFIQGPPRVQGVIEGDVVHRLWSVTDRDAIAAATIALEDKNLTIADGHHRYETAWAYRNEVEEARGDVHYHGSAGFRLVMLVNSEQPGVTILPTHRLLLDRTLPPRDQIEKALGDLFAIRRYPFHGEADRERVWQDFLEDVRIEGTSAPSLGLVTAGEAEFLLAIGRDRNALAALVPKGSEARRQVDTVLLHEIVLPRLLGAHPPEESFDFVRGAREALDAVSAGRARSAILTVAPRLSQVLAVGDAGDVFPPKSTDFYPKLATGIAIHKYEGPTP